MDNKRPRQLVDRLSTLPDHLLHKILSSFTTFFVARTSILSKRWRHLWYTTVPIHFDDEKKRTCFSDSVDKALDRYDTANPTTQFRFQLRITDSANAARLNPWVHFAAQHNAWAVLLMVSCDCDQPLELPLWESVRDLNLAFNHGVILKLAPVGTFHSLRNLTMKNVRLGPDGCNFGDVVSSACPQLRWLEIIATLGLENLKLSPPELQFLIIERCKDIRQLVISSKKLLHLSLRSNSFSLQSLVEISAPRLMNFYLLDFLMPNSTLGDFCSLRWASICIPSSCKPSMKEICSKYVRKSLSWFAHVQHLRVRMGVFTHLTACQDFINEETAKTIFHAVRKLSMCVNSKSAFGGSAFYLLRSCYKINELCVKLRVVPENLAIAVFARHCSCNLRQNWRYETLPLNSLREAQIRGFRGLDHEVNFVKLLLRSSAALKKLTVTFAIGGLARQDTIKELREFPRASCKATLTFI